MLVTCGQLQDAMSELNIAWIKKTFSPGSAFVLPAGYVIMEQCLNNEASLTLRLGYLAPCDLPNFEALVAAISAIPTQNNELIAQCLTALQKSLDGVAVPVAGLAAGAVPAAAAAPAAASSSSSAAPAAAAVVAAPKAAPKGKAGKK